MELVGIIEVLSCVCIFYCDRMYFGSKNCEIIKWFFCFFYISWNKYKFLSRCVICMCCEIIVELIVFFVIELKEFCVFGVLKSD